MVGQVSAHDNGTTSHLWDHFKALKQPGTINSDTNPVDWTKLKGVPAGIADGRDDGVEGAGLGLNKAFGTFFVDTSEIQRRVADACPSGRAIKAIEQDGDVVCTPVSQALSASDNDSGYICNDYCQEGSLLLAPGSWAVTAKISAFQAEGLEDDIQAGCRLHAGTASDQAHMWVDNARWVTLQMQIVVTLVAGDNLGVYLDCRDWDTGQLLGEDLSIIAIRVGG